MTENKQYILIPFEEGNLIFKDDGREFFNSVDCLKDNEIVDLLNEQDKSIDELKSSNHNRAKIIIQLTDKINQLEKEKQDILDRIDDYIYEWEDEGTPVADEMKRLKRDIEEVILND